MAVLQTLDAVRLRLPVVDHAVGEVIDGRGDGVGGLEVHLLPLTVAR